ARHKFANATLADFIDNLASATDRDVHAWAGQWLRTTGIDTLTAETGTPAPTGPAGTPANGNGQSWALTVTREGSRPHRITVGAYDHALN
ncbi:aminopeptidase N, partial [Streptomyces sp. SID7982]|nr:aminopeptidase N [Streptomyces sp. SID7982]